VTAEFKSFISQADSGVWTHPHFYTDLRPCSFYRPIKGGRLSRPRHWLQVCSPCPRMHVYRSGWRDKHNCPRCDSNLGPLTPQSNALTTRPLRPANDSINLHWLLSVDVINVSFPKWWLPDCILLCNFDCNNFTHESLRSWKFVSNVLPRSIPSVAWLQLTALHLRLKTQKVASSIPSRSTFSYSIGPVVCIRASVAMQTV